MKWMGWIASWFGVSTKSAKGSLGIGLRATLSGASPGGWASDHREETAHNTGFNYVAIHAIASQVAGATVTVFDDGEEQPQRRSRRKALAARAGSFTRWKSTYGLDDRETDPLPTSHPLVQLLRRPNPLESGADFRYRQAQQIRLTGTCLVWNVPSVSGRTCERYVIPTSMASPVAPTTDLPRGGWRINPVASRYTPIVDDGYVECPSWHRILGQIVDARQVQLIRLPHAWYLDDGQSPLSAGARWVDAGDAVDVARFHQLRNGVDPSVVWNLPPDVSPDQDEMDRVQAKISAKYGGPENVGRVMVAQSGTSITPLTTAPKDMCYSEGFHDFKAAILALHQTPPVAVGLQEPGAYAAYNASMKAWRHAAIQPLCDMLAESDTVHLASQFGTGLTIEIESDTVDDTELIETQLQNDLAAKVRTKNEWRAVRGMPPLPGDLGNELVGTDIGDKQGRSPIIQSQPGNQVDHTSSDSVSDPSRPDLKRLPDAIAWERGHFDDVNEHQVDRTQSSIEQYRSELIADILYGIFGDETTALLHDWRSQSSKSFDPDKHPRDRLGQFARAPSQAEVESAHSLITSVLNHEKPNAHPHHVADALANLSDVQLQSIHRATGYSSPPETRRDLVRAVMAHLTPLRASARTEFREARPNGVSVYIQHEQEANSRLRRKLGLPHSSPALTPKDWGDLVGAQPGSRVYVMPKMSSMLEIVVDHPHYRARRRVDEKSIYNEIMKVAPSKQQQGLATRILKQQIETAKERGVRRIELHAEGNGSDIHSNEPNAARRAVGYYVWARLGFSGDISGLMKDRANGDSPQLRQIARDFYRRFPSVTDVSDMMINKERRDWWRKFGGAFDGTFSLEQRSLSHKRLNQYLAEKQKSDGRKSLISPSVEPLDLPNRMHPNDAFDAIPWFDWETPESENPDRLTPQDEQILDRIWDQLQSGFQSPNSEENQTTPDSDP